MAAAIKSLFFVFFCQFFPVVCSFLQFFVCFSRVFGGFVDVFPLSKINPGLLIVFSVFFGFRGCFSCYVASVQMRRVLEFPRQLFSQVFMHDQRSLYI